MSEGNSEGNSVATSDRAVGLCFGCDYPLRGLAGHRCPECGRAFDPDNAATVNAGRPLGRLGRWVLKPVGGPVIALAMVPLVWLVWEATDPQLYYLGGSGLLSAFVCVLVGLVHGTWVTGRRAILRLRRQPKPSPGIDRGRWRVVWGVAGVVVALVLLEMPMRLAFLAHRPAFEELVREVRANAPSCATLPGRRVGIYTLDTFRPADVNGGAVMFRFGNSSEGGFAYLPNGDHELAYNSGDHGRLWRPWSWFSED